MYKFKEKFLLRPYCLDYLCGLFFPKKDFNKVFTPLKIVYIAAKNAINPGMKINQNTRLLSLFNRATVINTGAITNNGKAMIKYFTPCLKIVLSVLCCIFISFYCLSYIGIGINPFLCFVQSYIEFLV